MTSEPRHGDVAGACPSHTFRVPDDLRDSHDALISAIGLMREALRQRRQAALSLDMQVASNASAAAAGSLLLLDRSRSSITAYFQRPGSR